MGYQQISSLSDLRRVLTDTALSRRLTFKRGSAAARLPGATRVRFSYGLPEHLFLVRLAPRPHGHHSSHAADFPARLRRGAPLRRDQSASLVAHYPSLPP